MGNTFTSAIIRELGRNYGKAISNVVLGDAHSTPYRRVGSGAVLGSSSGGYKYQNNLDRLISNFQIKGKIATFNSGQNIFNAFFELVKEANNDNRVDFQEAIYLCEQYLRTIRTLDTISNALSELGDKEKSQIIIHKVEEMSNFMKELDSTFQSITLEKKEIKKTNLIIANGLIAFSIVSIITYLLSVQFEFLTYDKVHLLYMIAIVLPIVIASILLKDNYKKKVRNEEKKFRVYNDIKKHVSSAANIVTFKTLIKDNGKY